jgi:GNAT superfamily N-acetyltransferase
VWDTKVTITTNSLNEAKYRLARAFRIRGFSLDIVNERTFSAYENGYRFSLSFMPGNRRILISHDTHVDPEKRDQGLGKKMLGFKEVLAKDAGVNLLLATVRNDNHIEIHLLEKAGWTRLLNRKTGVSLWGKEL